MGGGIVTRNVEINENVYDDLYGLNNAKWSDSYKKCNEKQSGCDIGAAVDDRGWTSRLTQRDKNDDVTSRCRRRLDVVGGVGVNNR